MLLLEAPSNTTLQRHMHAVGVGLALAPLYFAGEYIPTTYRTGQRTDTIIAPKPQMSGGLSQPTASITRAPMNPTDILIRVVLKKKALFAQFLATAACEEVIATPARLCLESVVGAVCGTRLSRAMGAESGGFGDVWLRRLHIDWLSWSRLLAFVALATSATTARSQRAKIIAFWLAPSLASFLTCLCLSAQKCCRSCLGFTASYSVLL